MNIQTVRTIASCHSIYKDALVDESLGAFYGRENTRTIPESAVCNLSLDDADEMYMMCCTIYPHPSIY